MLIFNILICFLLTVASIVYLTWISIYVPAKYALLINIFLVPFLLGVVGAWIMKPPYYWKIILLMMIPLTQIILYGDDPAKKGLENVVALAELISIWLGVGFYYLINKLT